MHCYIHGYKTGQLYSDELRSPQAIYIVQRESSNFRVVAQDDEHT